MNVLMKTNNIEDLAILISLAKRLNIQVIETPTNNELASANLDANWNELALASLRKAYDDDEPEYSLDQIKVFNPNFDPSN